VVKPAGNTISSAVPITKNDASTATSGPRLVVTNPAPAGAAKVAAPTPQTPIVSTKSTSSARAKNKRSSSNLLLIGGAVGLTILLVILVIAILYAF
jgi:hypothetical protein